MPSSRAERFAAASRTDVGFAVTSALFPEELPAAPTGDPLNHDMQPLSLLSFQQTAALKARTAISRWGGVLLCDSVGLGKTYIALEVARHALAAGRTVVFVVPSSLKSQWLPLVRRHIASHCATDHADALRAVTLLTHAQLSRGGFDERLIGREGVLIIDEAHAFRSPHTNRYRAASRFALARTLCLITATPVNNSLWDLYYLIRLWAGDGHFASTGISHLQALFSDVVDSASTPARFRRLLREILIRRTRDDVRDSLRDSHRGFDPLLRPSRLRFPRLAPPVAITYDADGGARGSHMAILNAIGGLEFSALGQGSAGLLRFLFLKRLASSPAALHATNRRVLRYHREFVAACDEGLLLTPADMHAPGGRDEFDQLSFRPLILRSATPADDVRALRAAALADIDRLMTIERELRRACENDDKFCRLEELATGTLRHEKLLIFTEFRETSLYLWRRLVRHGGVALVHGAGACLGTGRASRGTVIERFSRTAADARTPERERVRVLIATDVLSEGLNLQECARVLSYDLPWNPVRLMQRVGRIDRLGSRHEQIFAYNFLPDRYLEEYLRILARLRLKLHSISLFIGTDRPVVAAPIITDEAIEDSWRHLKSLGRDGPGGDSGDSGLGHDGGLGHDVPDEGDRNLRTWLTAHSPHTIVTGIGDPTRADRIQVAFMGTGTQPPPGAHGTPKTIRSHLIYVFALDARDSVCCFSCAGPTLTEVDPVEVAALCVAAHTEPKPLDIRLRPHLPELHHVIRRVRSMMVTAGYSHLHHLRPRERNLGLVARRLQSALAAIPGGPTADQLAIAERLLAMLDQPASLLQSNDVARVRQAADVPFDLLASRLMNALSQPVFLDNPKGQKCAENTSRKVRIIAAIIGSAG